MASPLGMIVPHLAARRTRPAGLPYSYPDDPNTAINTVLANCVADGLFAVANKPAIVRILREAGGMPDGAIFTLLAQQYANRQTANVGVLRDQIRQRIIGSASDAAIRIPARYICTQARLYADLPAEELPAVTIPIVPVPITPRPATPGTFNPSAPPPTTDLRNGLLVSGAPSDAVFVLSDEASPAAVTRDERGVFVPHAPAAYTVRAKSGTTVAASQINGARYGEIPVTWDAMVNFASRIRVVGAGSGEVRINGADVRAAGFTDSRGAFVVASVPGSQGVTVDGRTVTVAPQSGQTVTITFPEGTVVMGDVQPAPVYGTIDLYGLLPTDGVLLDGVTTVPTMDGSIARLSRVTPGTHTLVVNRPNAAPFTTQVTVTPDVTAVVMPDFGPSQQEQQASTLGWLAVLAAVGGAAWWASKRA